MVPSSLFPLTPLWVPPWVRTRDAEPSGGGDYANPTRQSGPGWDTIPPVTPTTHLNSDAVLVDAVEDARRALESEIAPAAVGPHLEARTEGERVVTHLFDSRLADRKSTRLNSSH